MIISYKTNQNKWQNLIHNQSNVEDVEWWNWKKLIKKQKKKLESTMLTHQAHDLNNETKITTHKKNKP